jgi:aminoglycoside phosphotransferase (APT) family kinase protein
MTAPPAGGVDLAEVGSLFAIEGPFLSGGRYGCGHINDTFLAAYASPGQPRRYIHQRLNQRVFPDPAAVVANIAAVTRHLRARLETEGALDLERRVLTLVPARDRCDHAVDEAGGFWRTYLFVEGTRTVELVESEAEAFETARAFGEFQRLLLDYDGPRLRETIPGFHDTPGRFQAFERALHADPHRRAAGARPEADFVLSRASRAAALHDLQAQGLIAERIVHNDTKLNNLLIDDHTGRALCVVDLDTVMPGLALHDFGDMVRTGAVRAAEDERDLDKVRIEGPLFEALARGYLTSAGPLLSALEKQSLVTAAEVIVFEQGLRFLTDFLEGDVYYRAAYDAHNLDRCRTQLRLLASLEEQRDTLQRRVEQITREVAA